MKIAIIYPEMLELARFKNNRKEFPPFGPMILASILEEKGYTVNILKITNTKYTLDLSNYNIVAFSISASASFDIFSNCRFSSIISEKSQLLIAGGIHAQLFPEQTLYNLQLHAVCYSEGEQTILELVDAHIGYRNFRDVSSIVYKDYNEQIVKTLEAIPKKINLQPLPARHLLPREDIFLQGRLPDSNLLLAHTLFNRGCSYKCAYCAVSETRISYRTGESCRRELQYLQENDGIDGFTIVDDNFIINKNRVRSICHSIQDLGLKWSALSRVDVIDESILKDMVKAGCIEIKLGVESGDESLLKKMNKNTTISQIEKALRLVKSYNINTTIMILHGFPGENKHTTMMTLKLLKENSALIDKITMTRFVPLPGTNVYENPNKYNVHGTHAFNGWDGKWNQFSIHFNNKHWWGNASDFSEMNNAYKTLEDFVLTNWEYKY
ncbi:B12-binding domain-containing radical SAM protein [bacterium]|nr:B12-binding domain-containing radical SAM protein [bacterium]MBU1958505.1 B12-binding domain-containing radical SAM protein [bacterium]